MVSLLVKDSRCAHPPMTLCSTLVQPRNPKSTRRLPTSGEAAPPSLVRSKAASTTSRERRDSVATQVGYHTMVSIVSRKVHRGEYSPVAVICGGWAGGGPGAWAGRWWWAQEESMSVLPLVFGHGEERHEPLRASLKPCFVRVALLSIKTRLPA